jgi:hypothetical protein
MLLAINIVLKMIKAELIAASEDPPAARYYTDGRHIASNVGHIRRQAIGLNCSQENSSEAIEAICFLANNKGAVKYGSR